MGGGLHAMIGLGADGVCVENVNHHEPQTLQVI